MKDICVTGDARCGARNIIIFLVGGNRGEGRGQAELSPHLQGEKAEATETLTSLDREVSDPIMHVKRPFYAYCTIDIH